MWPIKNISWPPQKSSGSPSYILNVQSLNAQYSRWETLDVVEIPTKMKYDKPEYVSVELWETMDYILQKGALRPAID